MSTLRSDNIVGRDQQSSPSFPKGAVVTGVITATTFKGDWSVLTGIDATSIKDSVGNVKVQANTSGAVVTGVLTATSFSGDGSELDGIVGFSTAVSEDTTHFASDFYTATHSRQVPANTQYTVQGNSVNGNTVFTKLGQIHVAVGATFHIASGHNFVMNCMGAFD